MGQSVLVTGGAGFIGSHLCEEMLAQGMKVVILDNFDCFYDPRVKRGNVRQMQQAGERLKVIEGDIRDRTMLSRVFKAGNFGLVVHLAARAGVRPSLWDPFLYNDVNITGTLKLLEASRQHGVSKFIFASSSSVYGNSAKVPFSEQDQVDNPISPYAATKKAGELLCHTYHHLYGMDVACLRLFTVYGPRQRPDLAIHKFTRLILSDSEIPFYGDGSSERDYTYIGDIVDGILKAIDWLQAGQGRYEIFNLGGSRTTSLGRLVEKLETALGKRARLLRLPAQPGDVSRTYADISKAKAVLGYEPKIDLDAGLKEFVRWYKQFREGVCL